MDASGLSAFSALPLCPLMLLLWYLEKHSRQDMGFVWGRPRNYRLALLYPVLVLSVIAIIAAAAGALTSRRPIGPKPGALSRSSRSPRF